MLIYMNPINFDYFWSFDNDNYQNVNYQMIKMQQSSNDKMQMQQSSNDKIQQLSNDKMQQLSNDEPLIMYSLFVNVFKPTPHFIKYIFTSVVENYYSGIFENCNVIKHEIQLLNNSDLGACADIIENIIKIINVFHKKKEENFDALWWKLQCNKTLYYYISSHCINCEFIELVKLIDALCVIVVNQICLSNLTYEKLKMLFSVFMWITKMKTIHANITINNIILDDIDVKFQEIVKKYKSHEKDFKEFSNDWDYSIFFNIMNIIKNNDDKKTFLYMTYITYYNRAISVPMNLILKYIAIEIDEVKNDEYLEFYWCHKFCSIDINREENNTMNDIIICSLNKIIKAVMLKLTKDITNDITNEIINDVIKKVHVLKNKIEEFLEKKKQFYNIINLHNLPRIFDNDDYAFIISSNNLINATGICSLLVMYCYYINEHNNILNLEKNFVYVLINKYDTAEQFWKSILYMFGINLLLSKHDELFFNDLDLNSAYNISIINYINNYNSILIENYNQIINNPSILNMLASSRSHYFLHALNDNVSTIEQKIEELCSLYDNNDIIQKAIDNVQTQSQVKKLKNDFYFVFLFRLLLNYNDDFNYFTITCKNHIILGKFNWKKNWKIREFIKNKVTKKNLNIISYK